MKNTKSNYELTLQGIDSGAASINIELTHGKIIVSHGTDGTIIKEIKNAKRGSWNSIWETIENIQSVK